MARLNPDDGRLTPDQFSALHGALCDAYTNLNDLDLTLRARVGVTLGQVAALPNTIDAVVLQVISDAEDKSWTAELLVAARASRPTNGRLLTVSQLFGMATPTPPRKELELRISEANGFLDVVQWREGLAAAEGHVGRIELDMPNGKAEARGTGFLLGSDVVMTNYHVMEDIYDDPSLATRIGVRFDYKRRSDGVAVNAGQVYRLADDWDLDKSPYSPLDIEVDPPGAPTPEQLDYALIRLAEPAGDRPVSGGEGAEVAAPARGWIAVPTDVHDFTKRPALFILQHPDGRPLELAIDTNAVTSTVPSNGTITRVRYRTNTEPGSSGSPCFDADWTLIALHHSGDPKYQAFGRKPEYNEGIPIAAIRELLDARGMLAQLGKREL
jgi:trypsin-like peptidase/effector-associated domain 1 (EAD1)-containing protein